MQDTWYYNHPWLKGMPLFSYQTWIYWFDFNKFKNTFKLKPDFQLKLKYKISWIKLFYISDLITNPSLLFQFIRDALNCVPDDH